MARRATMTLDGMKAVKATDAVPHSVVNVPPERSNEGRKGQTLRLNTEAWRALKHLAVDENKSAHELMTEAVNMLFRDRKLPPIA